MLEQWKADAADEHRVSHGGVDRSVTVVAAAYCRRQKPMGNHQADASVGVPKRHPGVTGIEFVNRHSSLAALHTFGVVMKFDRGGGGCVML